MCFVSTILCQLLSIAEEWWLALFLYMTRPPEYIFALGRAFHVVHICTCSPAASRPVCLALTRWTSCCCHRAGFSLGSLRLHTPSLQLAASIDKPNRWYLRVSLRGKRQMNIANLQRKLRQAPSVSAVTLRPPRFLGLLPLLVRSQRVPGQGAAPAKSFGKFV